MSDARQAYIPITLASLNTNYPLKYLQTETYQVFLKIKQHSTTTSPAAHEGPWLQVLKQRDIGNILQPDIWSVTHSDYDAQPATQQSSR